jgi:hypothetical protein
MSVQVGAVVFRVNDRYFGQVVTKAFGDQDSGVSFTAATDSGQSKSYFSLLTAGFT